MNRSFAAVVFILLSFAAGRVKSQDVKPAVIPGEWELKPLAVESAPAPNGGQFHFLPFVYLDYPYWTQSGITAFWSISDSFPSITASRDKKSWRKLYDILRDKNSTLYSIKDGKIKKILTDGELLPTVGADKAQVERIYERTPIQSVVPGKNLLYINASHGVWMGKISMFSWDGDNLRLLLGNDSKIDIEGVTYNVHSAFARQVMRDGRVIVTCTTNKPDNITVDLVHDGVKFTPLPRLLFEDKPLPGMPGVLFDSFPLLPFLPGVLYDGGMIARLKVKGTTYKEALFRITPEKAEKIIAIDDPDPFDPTKKVKSFVAITAADKNNVAFVMNSEKKLAPVLVVYRDGKFQKVFDNTYPSVKNKAGWLLFAIGGGSFSSPDSPGYFFRVDFYRKSDVKDYNYEIIPNYFFFDGETLHHLTENAEATQSTRTIWLSGLGNGAFDANGVLFRGVRAKGYRVFDEAWFFELAADMGNSWLLEISGKNSSFKPAPEFKVPGKTVSLGNVVGWKSPTEAIVRLDDGIYLLSRLR